jgi:hypothetical protein
MSKLKNFQTVSMEVAEDTLLSDWFFNKELSFALAISFASCRIGSSLTSNLTPFFYSINNDFFLPNLVGLIFCFIRYIY